ncbi:MAG: hypothetical protein ACYTEW_26275 [Planctomycetota bacterium]|jgi:hypothetical protein
MISIGELDKEIKAKVEWIEKNNGDVLQKDWLQQAVMKDHDDVAGEDADFALCCMHYTVKARVEKHFRDIKENENTGADSQMNLPGYEHIQKRYIFERNGDRVAVPVQLMTLEEFKMKIGEHRKMGAGHYAHADELERYMEQLDLSATG